MKDGVTLSGTLGVVSLPGLLQLLTAEGRTGRLDVTAGARGGALWIDSGDIVHAECGSTQGEPALDELAALEEGDFTFEIGAAAPRRSLAGGTDHLLMESACRRDHARRGDDAVPGSRDVPVFAPVPAGGSTPRFTTLQWRVLASIDGHKDVGTIAEEIGLPAPTLGSLVGELVEHGVLRLA